MYSNSATTLPLHAAPAGVSPSRVWVLCALLVTVPAVVDLVTVGLNVSVLYALPLLVCAAAGRRRALPGLVAGLVGLTYGLYFLDVRGPLRADPWAVVNYRLLNRTFAVATLVLLAATLYAWLGVAAQVADLRRRGGGGAAAASQFDQLADALERLTAGVLCVTLAACVLATDLMAPGEVNLPILYAVPLLVAIWARSRRLLWAMVPVLVVVSLTGFVYGPPARVPEDWVARILTNRAVAMASLPGVAALLHFLIAPADASAGEGGDETATA